MSAWVGRSIYGSNLLHTASISPSVCPTPPRASWSHLSLQRSPGDGQSLPFWVKKLTPRGRADPIHSYWPRSEIAQLREVKTQF